MRSKASGVGKESEHWKASVMAQYQNRVEALQYPSGDNALEDIDVCSVAAFALDHDFFTEAVGSVPRPYLPGVGVRAVGLVVPHRPDSPRVRSERLGRCSSGVGTGSAGGGAFIIV